MLFRTRTHLRGPQTGPAQRKRFLNCKLHLFVSVCKVPRNLSGLSGQPQVPGHCGISKFLDRLVFHCSCSTHFLWFSLSPACKYSLASPSLRSDRTRVKACFPTVLKQAETHEEWKRYKNAPSKEGHCAPTMERRTKQVRTPKNLQKMRTWLPGRRWGTGASVAPARRRRPDAAGAPTAPAPTALAPRWRPAPLRRLAPLKSGALEGAAPLQARRPQVADQPVFVSRIRSSDSCELCKLCHLFSETRDFRLVFENLGCISNDLKMRRAGFRKRVNGFSATSCTY